MEVAQDSLLTWSASSASASGGHRGSLHNDPDAGVSRSGGAGNPFEVDDDLESLDLHIADLDFTSEDLELEDIDEKIQIFIKEEQENLEDDLVRKALNSGVDLGDYSHEIETNLVELESGAIKDYISQASNICKLHKQISQCDTILERMENMLDGFQKDLGSISSEIQSLQAQSIWMNVRLKNRQSVRGELSQFVDEMAVPEQLIQHIVDTPVTERKFLEQLHELSVKINFVKEQSFKEAFSAKDVIDVLEKLKIKAITKIRDYLLQKINAFKKPLGNYQIHQTAMLKVNFFFQFLLSHERGVAKEIRDEYVDTVSKVYFSYFKPYIRRVMRLQYEECPDKYDLMGLDDNARRGFFSSSKPVINKNKSAVFTLGDRAKILTDDLEAPALVPGAAQKGEAKYSYEALFRTIMFALMDNCCREYLFLCDFFLVSGSAAQDMFIQVMGKTLELVKKDTVQYVNESYDGIGNFLCLHIIYRYQVIMHKRQVPALDRYWDSLSKEIYKRFHFIVDQNIQSILDCDIQKMSNLDLRPHYVTRRSGEFCAGIISINENFCDERVTQLLAQLQGVVDGFLNRVAKEFPIRKDQLIFLINNYDLMLAIITERSREEGKETETINRVLGEKIQEFIEEVLIPHFGTLISFVKEAEALLAKNEVEQLRREETKVIQIVKSFAAEWKKKMEILNSECMRCFTNFKNGTHILQGALTQLIQYYHRFQKILSQAPFKNHPIRSELINIHHVMVEVKKFKQTF